MSVSRNLRNNLGGAGSLSRKLAARRKRKQRRRLMVEGLENRQMLATNLLDNGSFEDSVISSNWALRGFDSGLDERNE